MNFNIRPAGLLLALTLPVIGAACQPSPPPAPQAAPAGGTASASAPKTALGRTVDKALDEARKELRSQNISISDGLHINVNGHQVKRPGDLPKAEITPQGDLLIEGKTVAVNAAQRTMLLEYRSHIIGVAEAGMAIGMQGADLAAQAMGEAVKGIFSGKSEKAIEQSVEAQASGIKAAATRLCGQLPPMLATQDRLAAALPAFKPYATMTQDDIDDCMKDSKDGHKGVAITSD